VGISARADDGLPSAAAIRRISRSLGPPAGQLGRQQRDNAAPAADKASLAGEVAPSLVGRAVVPAAARAAARRAASYHDHRRNAPDAS
jgi:hypothetical protein